MLLNNDNKILKEELEIKSNLKIDYYPFITINNFTYRGKL